MVSRLILNLRGAFLHNPEHRYSSIASENEDMDMDLGNFEQGITSDSEQAPQRTSLLWDRNWDTQLDSLIKRMKPLPALPVNLVKIPAGRMVGSSGYEDGVDMDRRESLDGLLSPTTCSRYPNSNGDRRKNLWRDLPWER
jgi:hypothetical protein